MTYLNYIEHPRYGRLWYEMTLRNFCTVGRTADENRLSGPICEAQLADFMVFGSGNTPAMAESKLIKMLDWYAEDDDILPTRVPDSRWFRFRMWRLNRKLERAGRIHSVRLP